MRVPGVGPAATVLDLDEPHAPLPQPRGPSLSRTVTGAAWQTAAKARERPVARAASGNGRIIGSVPGNPLSGWLTVRAAASRPTG
jgi:hypothetical protein